MKANVVLTFGLLAGLVGCVATLPAVPTALPETSERQAIVVGRVVTVLMGPTTRWFEPQLRFFELVNSRTDERYRVDVQDADSWFVLPLPAGDYELSRLQISEGAFLGMAGLAPKFHVEEGQVTYVGTWRLGIESPQYNRSVLLSAVAQPEAEVRDALQGYPVLSERPLSTALLTPATVETRIFEVPPYPRFWWFRRHHTS
ncbi:hypothetical protein [Candidatus Nitrospira bockiana]